MAESDDFSSLVRVAVACCGLTCLFGADQAWAQQAPGIIPNNTGSITQLRVATAAPAAATIGGTPPVPAFSPLTFAGITVYGNLDVGVGYMSHATYGSGYFGPGSEYLVSKNGDGPRWGVMPNALSYSTIGVRGKEKLASWLNLVFDAQTTFVPTTLHLSNGLAALAQNNGVPLTKQSANGDSSRGGQILNGVGFGGFSNSHFGTLTYGRQNSLLLDGVVSYDPLFASNAFSLIGYQGATPGGGDTENARLNNAFKYQVNYKMFRFGALWQIDGAPGKGSYHGQGGDGAYQFSVGATIGRLDVDAIYARIKDAITVNSLSAAQTLVEPHDSLTATVSDDTAFSLLAKYHFDRASVFAGYENIRYADPGNFVLKGAYDWGYQLSVVNNTAYVRNRLLQVMWIGARVAATKRLSLDVGYYHELQNSYAANRCRDASSGACAGYLDVVSFVADYRLFTHFDLYAGAELSTAANGLASGFLYKSNVDPMIGGRLSF